MFDEELAHYRENKKNYLKLYKDKFVVIKASKLLGNYATDVEAYKAGLEKLGNQPFLIKRVEEIEPPANIPALLFGIKNARI